MNSYVIIQKLGNISSSLCIAVIFPRLTCSIKIGHWWQWGLLVFALTISNIRGIYILDYLSTVSGEDSVGWLGSSRKPWCCHHSTGQCVWLLGWITWYIYLKKVMKWPTALWGWARPLPVKGRLGWTCVLVVMVVMIFDRKGGRCHVKTSCKLCAPVVSGSTSSLKKRGRASIWEERERDQERAHHQVWSGLAIALVTVLLSISDILSTNKKVILLVACKKLQNR